MARLLLLFILVPMAELALLIQIGRRVGLAPTLGLIVATGVLGAWLARRQGLAVIQTLRAELEDGRIPAGPIVDGILILIAGAVLMTPGVLTDALGFACLIPAVRRRLKRYLRRRFQGAVERGNVVVSMGGGGAAWPGAGREVRDVTPPREAARPASSARSADSVEPPRLDD